MPTLQQLRQNAFVPYGTAGLASANNAAALPGPDLPPSGYTNFNYGGPTFGQGGNVSINDPGPSVNNINAVPGAGYDVHAGATNRILSDIGQGAKLGGGYGVLGGLLVGGARELYRRNRGNPSSNMRGANDRPAGGSGGLSNLFSGAPINQSNWTNYNTPYQHGAPFQGSNAFDRSGSNYYSDRQANLAQSAEDLALMASQANGGAANNTGTTQDTGHTAFEAQSHTHGLMDDGIVTIQPGGIYDTVFKHGMGASNPNAYHSAASLYQNPPESVGQAAPPLTAPTGPQPIGSGQAGPFVGPLQMPGPLPIGSGQPFQGPIQYPRQYPYNQPPSFYGGPIRGK